jgi:anthranilate synthase component 1
MLQELLLDSSAASSPCHLKIVTRELPADLETPVSAFLKLKKAGAKILLESVESGTTVGRYSFIGVQPQSRIIVNRNRVAIQNSVGERSFEHGTASSPLDVVRELLGRFKVDLDRPYSRLLGGAVGYIGYDFVRFLERIPDTSTDTLELPLASLYLIDTLLVLDHVQRQIRILTLSDETSTASAEKKLDDIADCLNSALSPTPTIAGRRSGTGPVSNFTERDFCAAVERVKKHILAGDVCQIVLFQRLSGETSADPFLIYRALRMLNPSPYMFFLDMDSIKLIGSSPEALVRLENGLASVRPIAGTRPRGNTEDEDRLLGQELLADEKEKAEHVEDRIRDHYAGVPNKWVEQLKINE